MLEGQFTLDDFLDQMQQLKKMGPLSKLIGHDARHAQGGQEREIDDKQMAGSRRSSGR